MTWAHKLLALEIAYVPEQEKKVKQQEYLQHMMSASGRREVTGNVR